MVCPIPGHKSINTFMRIQRNKEKIKEQTLFLQSLPVYLSSLCHAEQLNKLSEAKGKSPLDLTCNCNDSRSLTSYANELLIGPLFA